VTACSTPIFSNELGLGFHTSAFLRLLGRKKLNPDELFFTQENHTF
jgi:hypothetical protein